MGYLLGKLGNNKRALHLLIERLGDVKKVIKYFNLDQRISNWLYIKAIDFAKEQNDEELWEDLLKYSMDKPRKQRSLVDLNYILTIQSFHSWSFE